MITERQARDRLDYWHRRITASDRGEDSRDPHFLQWANRWRDYWAGKLTQIELEAESPRRAA